MGCQKRSNLRAAGNPHQYDRNTGAAEQMRTDFERTDLGQRLGCRDTPKSFCPRRTFSSRIITQGDLQGWFALPKSHLAACRCSTSNCYP